MSPIAEPPPPVWRAPIAPPRITRSFRPVAPYAPGGHSGIDLRTTPGAVIRAPCDGVVSFRGAVAGGPPTVTIRCGELRATLQRVRPSVGPGERVGKGARIGVATGARIDLSARRPDDTYLDPTTLIGDDVGPRVPPAVAPRRPTTPTRRAHHPARVADRALVSPHGAPSETPAGAAQRSAVDRPLGVAGVAVAATALVALALTGVRRRRLGAGQAVRALRPRVQR